MILRYSPPPNLVLPDLVKDVIILSQINDWIVSFILLLVRKIMAILSNFRDVSFHLGKI